MRPAKAGAAPSLGKRKSAILALAAVTLGLSLVALYALLGDGAVPGPQVPQRVGDRASTAISADLPPPTARATSESNTSGEHAPEGAADDTQRTAIVADPTPEKYAAWRGIPAIDVIVEEIPGLPSGRTEIRAEYHERVPRFDRPKRSRKSIAAKDGVVHFDEIQLPGLEEVESVDFYLQLEYRRLPLVESRGSRTRFDLADGGGWILRPQEPLAGICVVDAAGQVLWDEDLTLSGDHSWSIARGKGWIPMLRAELESHDKLRVQVRKNMYSFPGDLYPIDADGLMRLPLDELGKWDRELVIVCEEPLPQNLKLRIEQEWQGEYRPYDSGGRRGTASGAFKSERTTNGWTCRQVPPGKYRVSMHFDGKLQDGGVLIGEADLRHVARVVLDVPPFEFHRNLVLQLRFASDFDGRGTRPMRIRLDEGREGANWLSVPGGRLTFDWLGALPTTARVTGQKGPLHPASFPLEWKNERVALLDLSGEVLRRCMIDFPEDGKVLIAQELNVVQIGGPPAAIGRAWALLPAEGALWELCWWEGAEFEIPLLERDKDRFRPSDEPVLYDSLTPESIGRQDRFVPRRLSGYSARIRLRTTERSTPLVFAWLGDGVPTEERLAADYPALMRDSEWLSLGLQSASQFPEIAVPSQANGLLIIDQSARRRAYLVQGAWGNEIVLEALDWR